ncbi:hypothetical protein [Methanococcus maripaludis]|uniref:Uncharacterized protein n=1 Tax=Methanococcus maripaludis TaxID=39152 RepID=A0A7J9S104_METMI|nr:hypothetical protein [Methanococcus maripaludis]MBB6067933.1 hypothetical protein [Methanococcus maripaludis]MBM7408804.1 hypothetical protein [Methanococcus maripaludis]MBP2219027.1 hypothetical protein [Methanococcus maripaludis]
MRFTDYLKHYFKKESSYGLFVGIVVIFFISSILRLTYLHCCTLNSQFIGLIPAIEKFFGVIMSVMALGIAYNEIFQDRFQKI